LSRDRLIAGSLMPAAWLAQAQRVRRRAHDEALALFADADLLIAPATPVQATVAGTGTFNIGGRELPLRASMGLLTQPISCIGLPVCTVPLWPSAGEGGLPIGVQLIAAPWREDLCLAAARMLEQQGIAFSREYEA
jgi:aspartyl-tRNA(Asn)/glutamyl-tRNA(Gln) amidotransferase subunit A